MRGWTPPNRNLQAVQVICARPHSACAFLLSCTHACECVRNGENGESASAASLPPQAVRVVRTCRGEMLYFRRASAPVTAWSSTKPVPNLPITL